MKVEDGSLTQQPLPAALSDDERLVYSLIPHGRANALKQKYIAKMAQVSTRSLQDVLKRLTEVYGLPICSACAKPMGVFIPETPGEVKDFVAQLRARALSCFARVKALNEAAAHSLASEIQASLPLQEVPEAPSHEGAPDLPCTSNLEPGRRPTDDVPNGLFCWCGKALVGRQLVGCRPSHRDVANGRQDKDAVLEREGAK